MQKSRNNILDCLEREEGYKRNSKIHSARTTLESMCIVIAGFKLWNSLTEEIKESNKHKQV